MPHHAPPNEDMVTAQVVASAFNVHVKSVHRWALTVEGFPSYPIGKRERRFLLSEVRAFIMEHPERMASASEDYSTKRTLDAAKRKPKKKGPP